MAAAASAEGHSRLSQLYEETQRDHTPASHILRAQDHPDKRTRAPAPAPEHEAPRPRRVPIGMVTLLVGSSYSPSRYTASANSSTYKQQKRPQTAPKRPPGVPPQDGGRLGQEPEVSPPKKVISRSGQAQLISSPALAMVSHRRPGGANSGAKSLKDEQENFKFFATLPLFQELSYDKLAMLMPYMKISTYGYNTTILRQGKPAFAIIIVLSGQLAVKKDVERGKMPRRNILYPAISGRSDRRGGGVRPQFVRVATAVRGAVFGVQAALQGEANGETLTVDSIGAEVCRLNVADLRLLIDHAVLGRVLQGQKESTEWRDKHSERTAGAVIDAYQQLEKSEGALIPFPSVEEMRKLDKQARLDLIRPLNWNKIKGKNGTTRPSSATPSMQDRHLDMSSEVYGSRFHTQQRPHSRADDAPTKHARTFTDGVHPGAHKAIDASQRQRPSSAHARTRPSSALSRSSQRGGGGRETDVENLLDISSLREAEDINERQLFLSSWQMPERHKVYVGSKVGSVSYCASTPGPPPHWDIDIDAVNDLDGTYKPVY